MRELIPRVIAATLLFLAEIASAAILAPGSAMYAGQSIYSDNQQYMLTMQGDGNLVYYRVADGAVRWNTGTWNLPWRISRDAGRWKCRHLLRPAGSSGTKR
jgi:hypothetical protein